MPQTLTIDVVCSSRELFGSDRSGLRLAKLLRASGHDARLIVPSHRPEQGLEALALEQGVPYLPSPVALVGGRGPERPRGYRRSSRRSPEVTIYNTTAVVWCSSHGTRRIQVVREWLDPADLRHRALSRLHAARSAAVVAVSNPVRRQWERCAVGPRVRTVIHNWLDDDWLRGSDGLSLTGRTGIVCVGRFNQWKGQEILADAYLAAFARIPERPSLTFVGAEEPPSPFHDRAARLASRAPSGTWRILPVSRNPAAALASAALLVLPSLRPEPFGNVVLEALAVGCRVIAFSGGGPSDLQHQFGDALRVIPAGVESLAGALGAWWAAGGSAQSRAEYDATLRGLRSHYAPERARRDWQTTIDRVIDRATP